MMKVLCLLVLAVTLSASFASSETWPEGVEIIDIEVNRETWIDRLFGSSGTLAIVGDKPSYEPGAVATFTVQVPIPCTARYAYFGIRYPDGREEVRDVTSQSRGTCVSVVYKVTLKVPATQGTYQAFVSYKDANGREVYRETAAVVVQPVGGPCPTGYCTQWSKFQEIDGGEIQAKTCYHYAAGTCTQSTANTYRTVCNTGFDLQGGKCVSRSVIPVCGDGTVQAGEACDRGAENGACPSTCSSLCSVNTCSSLPSVPVEPAPVNDESNGFPWWLYAGGGAVLIGAGMLFVGGRRR